jgi:UPF0755 protein
MSAPTPRSTRRYLLVALLAVPLLLAFFAQRAYRLALTPLGEREGEREGEARYIDVKPGEAPRALGRRLEAEGIVRHAWAFRLRMRARKPVLKAGCYEVAPTMSVDDLIALFASGKVAERVVTFPEGWTNAQCAERAAACGFGTAEDYLGWADGGRGSLGVTGLPPGAGLQGYLFPATYRQPPTAGIEALVREQAVHFVAVWRELTHGVEPAAHKRYEYVTIASLIERETGRDEERPIIAGVIENRLAAGMKLQIDATVLYALGGHKTRLLYSDLQVDSPYNTYRVKGLPPGPIDNPGRASLAAAVSPAHHEYLYYVRGADGKHVFSKTDTQHNQAVAAARAAQKEGR